MFNHFLDSNLVPQFVSSKHSLKVCMKYEQSLSDSGKTGRWQRNTRCKDWAPLSPYFSFSIVLLFKKMLFSLRFSQSHLYMVVCCFNLSGGVALIVSFTTNGICVKNNTIIYVARASNSKIDCEHDLYCCLLPRCEALRTYRSGFPIATLSNQ